MINLENRVALVTGASRGIGRAIALQLAMSGAFVYGTATTSAGASKITAFLQENGIHGEGVVLDVTKQSEIDDLFKTFASQDKNPDVLVNNAGITADNLLLRMTDDEWSRVIETNLSSVYRLSKVAVKSMFRARRGRIISVGSVVGSSGNPGQANYAAAKSGIIGFSKSLAAEVASRGITVNVVAPGFIDTDMTQALPEAVRSELLKRIPAKRLGNVDDIANLVAFLASDVASYITGETIHVNGGMYMD